MMYRTVAGLLALAIGAGCSSGLAGGEEIPPGCGDGLKSATEVCDQADLGGATCASAVAPGWIGVVSCTDRCQLNTAGCSTPATTWSDISNSDNWRKYDVGGQYPDAKGFLSSVFDGRYLYLVPYRNRGLDGKSAIDVPNGTVVRYDTTAEFAAPNSWEKFDLSPVSNAAKGFFGGAFDGRYVYFVPFDNGVSNYHGTVVRYDTTGKFGDRPAWEAFDVSSKGPKAVGFVGAVFDGRYLYLVPYAYTAPVVGGLQHGQAARYDTQAPFTSDTSWSLFDIPVQKNVPNAVGFLGGTFDGRYVYFSPLGDSGAKAHGNVVRYDTKAAGGFSEPGSWEVFNIARPEIRPDAVGFHGAGFDGRYVYFAQAGLDTGPNNVVARYDSTLEFQNAASWQTFSSPQAGYSGNTFDGRYLYFPSYIVDGAAQYDTQKPFGAATSWLSLNMTGQTNHRVLYRGAGFDGQYVYFIPQAGYYPPVSASASATVPPEGIIVRFKAKSTPWLPRLWHSAFN